MEGFFAILVEPMISPAPSVSFATALRFPAGTAFEVVAWVYAVPDVPALSMPFLAEVVILPIGLSHVTDEKPDQFVAWAYFGAKDGKAIPMAPAAAIFNAVRLEMAFSIVVPPYEMLVHIL